MFFLKLFLSLLHILCFSLFAFSQDRTFVQQDATPLNLNPAFAGTNPQGRAMLLQRVQFPRSAGDFSSTYFSYDHNFPSQRNSLGLWIVNDIAGVSSFRSTNVNLAYAHMVPINKDWRLRLGLEVGYGTKGLNYINLIFGDQVTNVGTSSSPTQEAIDAQALNYLDISSGFLLHNKYLWLGFSAAHLNQPSQSFLDNDYRLPVRYAVQAGARVPVGDTRYEEEMMAGMALSYRLQGNIHNLDVGFLGNYKNVLGGIWYRNLPIQETANGALALQAGIQVNALRFTYAYEYAFGGLAGLGGAHEFGLSYIFRFPTKPLRQKAIPYVAFPMFSTYGNDVD